MQLVVLTSEKFMSNEPAVVNALFRCGLMRLHVRKPGSSIAHIRCLLKNVDHAFHSRIIVHQHPNLLDEFNLAGIHLKVSDYISTERPKGILSCSAHSEEAFSDLDRPWSEIFISPLYNSISKINYRGDKSLLKLGEKDRKGKLIALGGICADNILAIKQAGFDGAAVLGTIWLAPNPVNQFNHLRALLTPSY